MRELLLPLDLCANIGDFVNWKRDSYIHDLLSKLDVSEVHQAHPDVAEQHVSVVLHLGLTPIR